MSDRRHSRGVVLFVVLFFTLLLTASIATFLKRATVDAMLSRNRDAMARTEALARGGVELAKAVLAHDQMLDAANNTGGLDSQLDVWARAADYPIDAGDGAWLRLRIEDAGSHLNLNALFQVSAESGGTEAATQTELFLIAFFERMIEELPVDVQALYDPRALAENLIDWVDPDDTRGGGGYEDEYYQRQSPPYRAANRPLLSIEELGLIEGFDAELLAVIRPYVGVHPLVGGAGVNPNTAPPHILSLIFYNDGVDFRFVKEEDVERIIDAREDGLVFCKGQQLPECTKIDEILPNSTTIFPPLAYTADIFTIHSEARFANVGRTIEAVVDRSEPTQAVLLSWTVR